MPYNPGIQDRRADFIYGGLNNALGSVASLINKFSQDADQKEQLQTLLQSAGQPDPSATAGNPAQFLVSNPDPAPPMMGGGQDFQVSDPAPAGMMTGSSGRADQTDPEQYKRAGTAAKALRDYGSAAHGFDKNYLSTLSLPQLQGLLRGTEFRAVQAEQAQKIAESQQRMQHNETQNRFALSQLAQQDAMTHFGSDLGGSMTAPASSTAQSDFYENPENYPAGAPRPDINQAIFGALQKNPGAINSPQLDNILKVFERGAGTGPNVVDTVNLPYGNKGVSVRGSKDLKVLMDPSNFQQAIDTQTGQPIPGQYAFGNRPVAVPQPNVAQQNKLGVESLVEGEKAMQALDKQINSWNYQAADAKKDPKNNPAPDPAALQDLQRRRARLESTLAQAHAAGSAPAVTRAAGPPIGTIQNGYRYNGKYPPNDQRAWDKQ